MTATPIHWVYDGHREAFQQALSQLSQTHAVKPNGKINAEYGTALYLLTGLEYAWPRLQPYVTDDGIDYQKMVNHVALSSGEELIVGLSSNLFNGGTYVDATPLDLVGFLDNDTWQMVLVAFALRRGTLTLTMHNIADD